MTIQHSNVTLRCAEFRYGGLTALYVEGNISNIVIEDVKIDMLAGAVQNEALWVRDGVSNITMSRLEITRMQDGIKVDEADTFTIEDCYLYDMDAPGGDNHWDGLEMDGRSDNGTITGNNIINQYTDTSAIMIDNWGGSSDNITVDGNRLIGGGYTVYCDGQFGGGPLTNISFTNNVMGEGQWGYGSIESPCNPTWSGNVDDRTGDAIR